ncbi:TPA: hypothetical protein ACRNLW_001445 [Pseudomonas aeruginosa]|uniref:hypothetical protein n=1 Tax=Pseudomonas TaxID=286 RepID=UPI0003B966B2|nr:hypothetical protein [Pseudomonas aeruginosa]QBI82444.1 primosomal protein I [Pseudomonas phage vB_Pae_CF63a]AMA36793.1 hypothetical protein DPADHS01_12370 [Pseudomonas aeruginosa DHS01]ASD12148.1 hypothetical protein CD800_25000 [Pseudomonas aeruginosa]AWE83848.1 hypothetical protein CSC29_1552 [Pseudomonas aeruginosa]EIU6917357.1 hypothetical protein [Pseudomonas aeruginosa]
MNLADMLDRPIAFQRAFVSLGAGITGALMLSQAVYWTCRTEDADGWFYKTMDEWEAETGMTRSEQEGARKKLVKCGVLEEMKKGVPCRLYYRVNMDAIAANLNAENLQSSLQKTRKQGCGNPSGKSAEKPQASTRKSREQGRGKPAVLTETTSEITSEITPEISAGEAAPAPGGEFVGAEQEPGPRCQIPADMPGPKDPNCKAYRTWANYAMAYRTRYTAWPVWNASVAGKLSKLIDRVGQADAPKVAAFYVKCIHDARLIAQHHPLGLLLANAEGYHTMWLTNRPTTGTQARQQENTASNLSAAEQALAEQRARRAAHADA